MKIVFNVHFCFVGIHLGEVIAAGNADEAAHLLLLRYPEASIIHIEPRRSRRV
ncbi:MAG: hypothetical protein ACM359_20365 [Bacillota bacterium]